MRTALCAVVLCSAAVAGMPTGPQPPPVAAAWEDLGSADAARAYQAVWSLVRNPKEANPLLQAKLKPAAPLDSKAVEQFIKDLDSPTFAVRDTATRELEHLGELAGPALRKVNVKGLSLETRMRLDKLLVAQEQYAPTPEH